MSGIEIKPISHKHYNHLSVMVGDLLNEIMKTTNKKAFNFDEHETEKRLKDLIKKEKYWVLLAKDKETGSITGFVSLYESYALYSEGAYGTIPELYVCPHWRSKNIGKNLLKKAVEFGREKGWRRLEVTTPPLPQFERTLDFYQANGFEISGGKKLKVNLCT